MKLISFLAISAIASLLIGQIIRIPFLGGVFTFMDISVFVFSFSSVFYFLFKKKSLKLSPKLSIFVLFFIVSAAASTLLSLNIFQPKEVLISALFLFRFILYFSVYISLYNLFKKNQVEKLLNIFLLTGACFAAVGIFQFIFFPDLRFLAEFGWDPHYFRLVSTFIDPNFSGIFLVILTSIAFSFFLYRKKLRFLMYFFLFFTSTILTFSRSSYLALMAILLIIGVLKSPKISIVLIVLLLTLSLMIPKTRERIEGALKLDETASARFESWQKALKIIKKNYLFGVGFNTYRYAQRDYGFFSVDAPEGQHSGAGTDSSFLLILATTGILGTFFYLLFFVSAVKLSFKKSSKNPVYLSAFASLIALMIHSQFVNSLFFPPIMLTIWFFLSLLEIDAL